MDCFTLRVRSFECFIYFSKLRGFRPRQSISSSGILSKSRTKWRDPFRVVWYMDCFTLRVRSFEYLIFFFEIARLQAAAIHFLVWYIIEIANEVTRSISRRLVYGLLHTSCSQFRVFYFHFAPSDTVDCFTLRVRSFECFCFHFVRSGQTISKRLFESRPLI